MPLMTAREAVNMRPTIRPDQDKRSFRTRPLTAQMIARNARYIVKTYEFTTLPERREDSVAYVKFCARLTSRVSNDVAVVAVYVDRQTGECSHFAVEETGSWEAVLGKASYAEAARLYADRKKAEREAKAA